jgi:hypothetical protein
MTDASVSSAPVPARSPYREVQLDKGYIPVLLLAGEEAALPSRLGARAAEPLPEDPKGQSPIQEALPCAR